MCDAICSLGVLSSVGNILPFASTGSDSSSSAGDVTTVAPTAASRRSCAAQLSPDVSYSGSSNDTSTINATLACCENVTGLCEWVEPVGWLCIDEDDRKSTVWTEAYCLMQHPDDIAEFQRRFQAYKDYLLEQANALVCNG